VGAAAGNVAAFALRQDVLPSAIYTNISDYALLDALQQQIVRQGQSDSLSVT